MPSVIGLLEQCEAQAQEELQSWLEVLSQAQQEVAAATERAERARVAWEPGPPHAPPAWVLGVSTTWQGPATSWSAR